MSKEKDHHKDQAVTISKEEYETLLKKSSDFEQIQDRLLRSAADFENAKKRLTKEREDFFRYALEDFILSLLPVLDNFEYALSHLSGEDDKTKTMREGFLLIQKQLLQILSERGLKAIESIGKPFNPHVQEAVANVVAPDQEEGIILEELTKGYELNGKLLRPARVKVATKTEPNEIEKSEELS